MKFIIRSFSTRLSLYIILFSLLIFSVSIYLFYSFARTSITRESMSKASAMLTNTTMEIEMVLESTEVSIESSVWMIEENLNKPDSLKRVVYRMLESSDVIMAIGVAFEPNYFKEKGDYFFPYVCKTLNGIEAKDLGSADYNYHAMDWYTIPKLLRKNYWSEPYYDDGGGNMVFTTYSRPLYDKQGNIYAILTADLSLRWFTAVVSRMKPSERAYTFMVSRNGYYLTHTDPDRIMNETIFSATMEMEDSKVREIGKKMLDGDKSSILFMNDDTLSYAFFAPITHTGWSVCTVCPTSDILDSLHQMTIYVGIIGILGSLILLIVSMRVIKSLTAPLTLFASSAREIAQGNFSTKLPDIHTHDEMKELHNSFSHMQQSLVHYIDELKSTTATKERIESELSIAREIQMGMIPKIFPPFPERNDVDLYAILRPAKEVGGDLYDFFIDENKLYFTIGDVSGKGVPASLFMAVTRSLFRSVATHLQTPSKIVQSMNGSIAETNESNMFVTLFVGVLDLTTGNLQYCNAGHNPPVFISPSGEPRFMTVKPNIPVGLFDAFEFVNEVCVIETGVTLFLYTDGLTEAENYHKELYSEARLLTTLQANAACPPKALTEVMNHSIADHVNGCEQSDDLTILCIKFKEYTRTNNDTSKTVNMHKEITLNNEVEELSLLIPFTEELCDELNLSPAMASGLNLVLEEAVSNIILYGYPDKRKDKIRLNVCNSENKLIFTLSDHGVPFDPTIAPETDVSLSAEERPVGGLGIFLIRKMMDRVEYQRTDDTNILTMIKKLNT